MSQPPSYTPTTSFTDTNLNTEFNNLKTTLDSVLTNLALLQRDDDKFKDGIAEPHAFNLSPSAEGFLKNLSGVWSFIPDPSIPAETAKAAAEIAQAAAEAARDLASTYKNDAETAKLAAETAQAAAELAAQTTASSANIQSGSFWHAVSTGTGAAYDVVLNPVPASLSAGLFVNMKAHAANTGAATLNVNGLGVKVIKKIDGSDLNSGDIPVNALVTLVYDGTNFQITNLAPSDEKLNTITSNLFLAFDEIQENHAGSMLMEKSWSDSFGNANEQGADEANSSGYQHDNTNKLYKGTDAGTGLNSDKDYTTESNYIQQEWTNSLPATGQASVTNGDATVTLVSGVWPTNCEKGRISFDSGATWYDIDTRTDSTNLELTTTATETTSNYNYIIRMSEFNAGVVQLNAISDPNTNLLFHFDGSDTSTIMTDSGTAGHAFTAYGNAQLDTAQSKFGGSSLLLDGTGDYIESNSSSTNFNLGTDDFTLELWYRSPSVLDNNGAFVSFGTLGSFYADDCLFNFDGDGNSFLFYFGHPTITNLTLSWTGLGTFSTNTWYHVAYTRTGTSMELYIDGVSKGTKTCHADMGSFVTPKCRIGDRSDLGQPGTGHIDELRWSKGVRRYTTNFTPPTTAFAGTQSNQNEYVSLCDSEPKKTNTSAWTDINSGSVTETLNSQNAYYWLTFDPASGFGDGTEIKIFNSTDSVWRVIAKNNSGTWEYNNDSGNSATYSGTASTVNDMLHAISQAMSTQTGNRMTGTNLAAITDTQWEETGGWSASVNYIVRGITLYSNNSSQNPSVSQYRLNYDSERGAMDLRSKTYDPGFVPDEAYVWSRAEHSDADGLGTFSVTRNGGTEWTTVPMTQQGEPLSGDVRILRGTVDISGQASGQDLRCRYQTTVGKDQYLHSWGLLAKS